MSSQLLVLLPSRHGRLRLGEVLDGPGRDDLRRTLAAAVAAGCTRLEVDGGRVRHIEFEAVEDLCDARSELAERGGVLSVRSPSWVLTSVLRWAGRTELLDSDERDRRTSARARPGTLSPEPVDLGRRRAERGRHLRPRHAAGGRGAGRLLSFLRDAPERR